MNQLHVGCNIQADGVSARIKPLRIYLDSSDYSTLSDPRRTTPPLVKIRNDLLRFAREDEVEFRFSAAHICEISPLNQMSQDAAEARASLLSALCGTRALISPTCLIERELRGDGFHVTPYADDGEWFPAPSSGIGPTRIIEDTRTELHQTLTSFAGLNRAQRRAKLRQVSGKKLKALVAKSLYDSRETLVARIKDEYPMRDEDAATLYRYICGSASPEEAEDAFFNSLRDPKWMSLWFAHHRELMLPVVQWMRKPGQDLSATLVSLASTIPVGAGGDRTLTTVEIRNLKEHLLTSLAQGLSVQLLESEGRPPHGLDLTQLSTTAPGFYAMLSTFIEGVALGFSDSPRAPRQSDFLDAIHATYAPYVDVFRADRFTSSLLQRALAGFNVTVVSRLENLVPTIEDLRQRRRALG